MKRNILKLLILTCLAALLTIGVYAGNGSTPGSAVRVSMGTTYTKTWDTAKTPGNCYNKFTVSARGYVTLKIKKATDDEGHIDGYKLTVYDSNLNQVWYAKSTYTSFLNTAQSYQIYRIGLKKGTYYVNIVPVFKNCTGEITTSYSLKLAKTGYYEIESNNTKATATKMTVGHLYGGTYCDEHVSTTHMDYFKVKLTAGKTYRLKLSCFEDIHAAGGLVKMITAAGKSQSITYNLRLHTSGVYNYYDFTASTTGYYYICLWNCGWDKPVSYKLGVIAM